MDEIKKRKLVLKRETVMPLQAEDLENVQGGGTVWKSIKESIKQSVKWSGRLLSAKEVYDSAKDLSVITGPGGGGGGPKSQYFKTPGGCAD